jgi:pimeloyl-ACP methyl ester carboxylesterase
MFTTPPPPTGIGNGSQRSLGILFDCFMREKAMNAAVSKPQSIAISGGQISYIEAGQGRALAFLHGIGSAAASWRHQIEVFAPRFRCIAWNAPGYVESTPPASETPTAGDYARALGAFLDALRVERCHLVAHSLGTLIAARFAAEFGQRLLSLTLCGASGGQGNLPADQRAALLQERLDDLSILGPRGMAEKRGPRLLGPKAAPAMIREVVEIQSAAVRPEGYKRAARMLSNADIFADIKQFPPALPVQVVYGEDDAITPPPLCRRIAAACRNAVAHPVPAAGHALYLENPARVNALIDAFVSTVEK